MASQLFEVAFVIAGKLALKQADVRLHEDGLYQFSIQVLFSALWHRHIESIQADGYHAI
jgi:hypothetical protein